MTRIDKYFIQTVTRTHSFIMPRHLRTVVNTDSLENNDNIPLTRKEALYVIYNVCATQLRLSITNAFIPIDQTVREVANFAKTMSNLQEKEYLDKIQKLELKLQAMEESRYFSSKIGNLKVKTLRPGCILPDSFGKVLEFDLSTSDHRNIMFSDRVTRSVFIGDKSSFKKLMPPLESNPLYDLLAKDMWFAVREYAEFQHKNKITDIKNIYAIVNQILLRHDELKMSRQFQGISESLQKLLALSIDCDDENKYYITGSGIAIA